MVLMKNILYVFDRNSPSIKQFIDVVFLWYTNDPAHSTHSFAVLDWIFQLVYFVLKFCILLIEFLASIISTWFIFQYFSYWILFMYPMLSFLFHLAICFLIIYSWVHSCPLLFLWKYYNHSFEFIVHNFIKVICIGSLYAGICGLLLSPVVLVFRITCVFT